MRPEINASQYSVVVVGAMNPAIHHPQWYEAVGILTSTEAQEAVRSGHLIIVPQLAQFQLAAFQIQCTPDKWQVNTADIKSRSRIIDVAAETFSRLSETPISAYGLNARFDVNTGSDKVVNTLGRYFAKSPLDFSFDGIDPGFESFTISYSLPPADVNGQPSVQRQLKAMIMRSPRASDAVEVNINGHHQIEQMSEFSHFDLAVLLRASANIQDTTDLLLKHILATLSGLQE